LKTKTIHAISNTAFRRSRGGARWRRRRMFSTMDNRVLVENAGK